ncbi:MAG: hypothetical protein ACRDJN_32180 [Chloroflexota bacterium]
MGRGLAWRPVPCATHPHRAAVDHCDECWRSFCRECLVRGGPQLRCRECWTMAPVRAAAAARKRRITYRLHVAMRENRASLIAGSIITTVLLTLGVSSMAGILDPSARAQMAEPVARVVAVRRARGGGGEVTTSGSLTPLPGPTRIPTLLRSASAPPGLEGTDIFALRDGRAGDNASVWRSPDGRVAVDLRVTTGELVLAGRVLFAHSEAAPAETWARDVEVWIAPQLDAAENVRIGRWTLEPTTAPQEFAFSRSLVRSVRLRILSNFGSAEYTSLAEFALLPAAAG